MMNDLKGSISVIIPAYNSASFLGDAIESVLRQTVIPKEIIVINDGSTDETETIVTNIDGNIRYVYQENHGPSHARNSGVQIARGDYIAFIDADDVWTPENLSIHMNQFKKFDNLDISIGLTSKLRFNSTSDIDMNKARNNASLHLSLCASIMKRTVFDEVGFFDEDLYLGQDTDFFLRAKEKQKRFAISRELVSLYRRHSNNRTNNKKMVNHYFFKVFKKAKDRRSQLGTSLHSMMMKPENQTELIELWHNVQSNK